ncbi:MAG: OmpA family protein [Gammaproteobacteria bacterium]
MNKDPLLKLQSSKTIEELLSGAEDTHRSSWLLSYLDVFVLIVMLIITLITLSDLKIEQESRKPTESKTAEIKPVVRPLVKKTHPAPAEPVAQPEPNPPRAEPEATPASSHEPPDAPEKTTTESANEPVEQSDQQNQAQMPVAQASPPEIEPAPASAEPDVLKNSLTDKLSQLGLSQSVEIKITEDYAQLEIQDKILFESSKAGLTGSGENLLKDLAPLLKQANGLIFIEGHTDDRPINTLQFPSNWELGSARATSVLHYLATQGLDSSRMRAVTYADTMPIADNSTPEGREKNRRVSILIKVQEQDIRP